MLCVLYLTISAKSTADSAASPSKSSTIRDANVSTDFQSKITDHSNSHSNSPKAQANISSFFQPRESNAEPMEIDPKSSTVEKFSSPSLLDPQLPNDIEQSSNNGPSLSRARKLSLLKRGASDPSEVSRVSSRKFSLPSVDFIDSVPKGRPSFLLPENIRGALSPVSYFF